ncbi:MAG TPA: hypothetical protein PKY29_04425 [Ferruginibacter sp.]|nr:hypothetical protein [Ferruginibacter sp.]HRQ20534.1 hypothetical protein [Ferruginibacter sp.]
MKPQTLFKLIALIFCLVFTSTLNAQNKKVSELPLITGEEIDSLDFVVNQTIDELTATKRAKGFVIKNVMSRYFGDSARISGGNFQLRKNGSWITQFAMLDTAGQFVTAVEALNDTVARSKKGGVWTNFNVKGRNFHAGSGLTRVSQSFKLGGTLTENTSLFGNYPFSYTNSQGSSFSIGTTTFGGAFNIVTYGYYSQQYLTTDTLRGVRIYINKYSAAASSVPSMGFNIGMDTTKGIAVIGEDISLGVGEQALYYLPKYKPLAGQTSIAVDPTTRQSYWTTPSGGGGSDNFPTVDDTLTGNRFLFSDTYNLLFSHASGNAFTLSNTGLSYDVAGSNAVVINSSFNEFKTPSSASVYGMLKTTSGSAGLYAQNGANSSSVYAYPRYVELKGQDSTVVKNIEEVVVDTSNQHVMVLQGDKVVKTKWQVLKADSTLIISGDSIRANPRKILGYREYVAHLQQEGTDAPVATVLKNTLGGTVVWARSSTGIYTATLVGAFTSGKTTVKHNNRYISPPFENDIYQQFSIISADVIEATVYEAGSPVDGQTLEVSFRVYD